MAAAEGFAAVKGDGDHDEDDEGAEVRPQVGLHGLFDDAGEGEQTYHAEGEEQLKSQDAEDLQWDAWRIGWLSLQGSQIIKMSPLKSPM